MISARRLHFVFILLLFVFTSIFGVFIETVYAADTTVDAGTVSNYNRDGPWGPYWISSTKAATAYVDSNSDMSVATTTDGGATWNKTVVVAGNVERISVWFDQENPGDTGNLLHIGWLDSVDNKAYYVNYDINTDTLGTVRTVASSLTVSTTVNQNRMGLTKTVSGNIIFAYSTQVEIGALKSSNNFATGGTTISDVFETGTEEDWLMLAPAATADDNDAAGFFWDRSANAVSVKMYDDSANSWSETSIDASAVEGILYTPWDLAVRHSDSAILLAYHDGIAASSDFHTVEIIPNSISSPTVTSKTSIFTAQTESYCAGMLIDQTTDDVYVAYCKGGTWQTSTDIVYHKSTNDMGTWGSEQSYSETTRDYRGIRAGRTIGSNGGFFQPFMDDADTTALYSNLVNDVAFSGGSAPSVATNAATGVETTSATLNGNITATGGSNATARGFAWGTNSALSGGDTATTTDSGSFGTGTFSNSGLTFTPGTTYYFRAYATNPTGTGFGSIKSFFTGVSKVIRLSGARLSGIRLF